MNLYEIALPARDNAGKDVSGAHRAWQARALWLAHGYTEKLPARGVWQDGGTTYVDEMIAYQVACDAAVKDKLLAAAFELFPDQLAIFVSQIGTATIHGRPT